MHLECIQCLSVSRIDYLEWTLPPLTSRFSLISHNIPHLFTQMPLSLHSTILHALISLLYSINSVGCSFREYRQLMISYADFIPLIAESYHIISQVFNIPILVQMHGAETCSNVWFIETYENGFFRVCPQYHMPPMLVLLISHHNQHLISP